MAKVSFHVIPKEVSLEMLTDINIDDFVLAYDSVVISKVDDEEALKAF